MLPRTSSLRSGALLAIVALVAALLAALLVEPSGAQPGDTSVSAKAQQDPRKTRGLFVDPKMPGANQGPVYKKAFGSKAQALWIIPEAYGTSGVRNAVRAYTSRAIRARKTPTLSIYGIPGRDCGGHSSSGALKNAEQYRAWIRQVGRGLKDQKAIVILEPDALPFFGSDVQCDRPEGWLGMLRFASRTLSSSGAWVYIDAGHSDWRPYEQRPAQLKQAGIEFARGFSTNVSNFRSTADEKAYAQLMVTELRKLGVKGVHYVIDTSRNGAADPVAGDVLNPTWARVGKAPRLVFDGAFDGTLWVKHPGESDGQVNGGSSSGKWCDMLADKLIDGTSTKSSCPE